MNKLLFILLQADLLDETMLTTVREAAPAKMNLWTMATYGGPIMIILALMLALAIYMFIERYVTMKQALVEDKSFMDRIRDYIHDGKIDAAQRLCKDTNNPISRMIDKGISRLGRPMSDVLVAIENSGSLEIANLEKGLVILASIAGGAPMLGFLGTVTGMVRTFYNMSLNEMGTIQLSDLSVGMYQAMITTIAGLIVGIVAYFGYNYLVSRVDSVVRRLETRSIEFLDLLNEPV